MLMLDAAIAKFFDSEEQYLKAEKVLGKYQIEAVGDWKTAEAFLTSLDSYDSYLLEQAIKFETLSKRSPKAPAPAPAPNPVDGQLDAINKTLTVLTENQTQLDSKPISALISAYIQEIERSWKPKNADTNKKDIVPKLRLIVDVLGEIESKELKPANIVQIKDTLAKLPSNRTKGRFAGKSIADLLVMEIPKEDRLSGTTLKNYTNKISSFLKWLARNSYCAPNLEQPLAGMRLPTKADHEQRPIFTPEQLHSLFQSEQYTRKWHNKPSHYWVPLLALFTGARQNEICQLYKEDIYSFEDTKTWVIDINEKDDKKLKNAHSARIIPIHKQLLDMGFLDYVASVNHDRVFPDLENKKDGYGQKLSRWFCDTYMNAKNCNIKNANGSTNPVFHSFRHTVATKLDEQGIPAHQISHLLGHTPSGGSETTARYIKPKGLLERAVMVNKLKYPSIDFSKIRNWKRGHKAYHPKGE